MHLGLQISIMEPGVRPVCEWEEREVTVWSRNSVLGDVSSGLVPYSGVTAAPLFTQKRTSDVLTPSNMPTDDSLVRRGLPFQ